MRQLVVVKTIAPANQYKFKIVSIYETKNQLIVVSQLIVHNRGTYEKLDYPLRAEYVETSVDEELPIVHYMLDEKDIDQKSHLADFGRRYFNDKSITEFKAIKSLDEISSIIHSAKLCFQCRADGLIGFRLGSQDKYGLPLPLPEFKDCGFERHQLESVLNIYTLSNHDEIQLVLESIQIKTKDFKPLDFEEAFSRVGAVRKIDFNAFKDNLLIINDDAFSFEALVFGKSEQMITHAVAFTLPHDPEIFRQFMQLLNRVISVLGSHADGRSSSIYGVIQLSPQSVLACFDKPVIKPEGADLHQIYKIDQSKPLPLVQIMHRPGTHHFPESMGEFISQVVQGRVNDHREDSVEDGTTLQAQGSILANAAQARVTLFTPTVVLHDQLEEITKVEAVNQRVTELPDPDVAVRPRCGKGCSVL
jgi:hypothetical protein